MKIESAYECLSIHTVDGELRFSLPDLIKIPTKVVKIEKSIL